MIYVQEKDGYVFLKCKKCNSSLKVVANSCKKHDNDYYFNPPVTCSGCGNTEIIAYKDKNFSISNYNKLIKCPICQKDISSDSDTCIHCGHPMKTGIKCPTCSSTNIKKISTTSKVGSAVVFGIFSLGKLSKTFECKNCGYRW